MNSIYKNIHQDIIDRCKRKDRGAQFQLYKLYYKAMFNTSLNILRDRAEAEDIMQEAFLSAFEKIESYRGEVSFGVWLKKIVINRSLDALRSRKIDFTAVEGKEEVLEDTVEQETFSYNIEEIKEAINKLSEGYRTVLSLFLIEGYDHEEISQLLGVSNATSRSQYMRAKQRLKKILLEKYKRTISLN